MSYGGEITVSECWELLSQSRDVVLIDVRTNAEWAYVGVPALPKTMNSIIGQQWQVFPNMSVDPEFADKLMTTLNDNQLGEDTKLCFLCRSGVRSLAAAQAMWERGYKNSFNITHGFEGDLDGEGRRGNVNGWKAHKLPWQQG